jgi:lia operon protein LiaG
MRSRFRIPRSLRTALPLGALLLSASSFAATSDGSRQALPGSDVAIYNLVGTLEVVRGEGSNVTAEVRTSGPDAGKLKIVNGVLRGRETLRVIYPGDRIVVPEFGSNSNSNMRVRDDGTFGDDKDGDKDEGREVRLSGHGPGIEARADIRVLVPAGKNVAIHWGHGKGALEKVDGKISVEAASMPVTATGMKGDFRVEVGSGDVRVSDSQAEVSIETGSGDVALEGIQGVELAVETGSGEVTGHRLTTQTLSIETGSGQIEVGGIGADRAKIETGSGEIKVDLARDVRVLSLDSGSGDISVRIPKDVGAKISAETGSGGIETDLPLKVTLRKRNELSGTIGDGNGSIRIETGSGDVEIRSIER